MSRRHHFQLPRAGRYLPPLGNDFVSIEALSGLVLLAGAVAAIVWANLAPGAYGDVWGADLTLGAGDAAITLDLRHWVNDALMALFFLVVGLEIKREFVDGELADLRTAGLPVLAALGGMVVPAAIYAVLNGGHAGADGWGIPMATDIAFAIGVLAILGSRVAPALKLFLLTLAIVDDIGAIVVIAVFYSAGVEAAWLGAGVGVLLAILMMRRLGVASTWWYVVPAIALWICTHESGVHATIAGFVLALVVRGGRGTAVGPLERLEHTLHPWSSFVIVPLFALANAGIVLSGATFGDAVQGRVFWGVVLGLVVGKAVGIAGFTALGMRMGLRLPSEMTLRSVVGIGALAGIGFTVSLFVADLSFAGERLEAAKLGILAASLLAGILGAGVLALLGRGRATRTISTTSGEP